MTALKRIRKEGNGLEALELARPLEMGFGRLGLEMEEMMERFWRNAFATPLSLFSEWSPWAALVPAMSWPAIDVAEDEKALVIRADVPGLEARDLAVEISENVLTIRGSRQEEESEKTAELSRHERRFGRFERRIALPSYVDAEKIEAKYEKGTLSITVPRIPGEGPKRIPVQTA